MQQKTDTRQRYLSNPYLTAILVALIVGLITHLFGMVNPMHNHDDISVQPFGFGAGITSGRWFLSILGYSFIRFGFSYNLPWVNGLVFLVLIAVSAGFLVHALEIHSKLSAILIGAMMAVFPSVTSTMYYRFTAPYYGIAILFAILAAWICGRYKFSLFFSAICTALSLGIYQAYTPITIAIFVLILIRYALSGKANCFGIIRRGLYYCLSLILGVLLYYVCLKILLSLSGLSLSDYKGINQMGVLSLQSLPSLVINAFTSFLQLTYMDYYGLSFSAFTQKLYLLLIFASFFIVGHILVKRIRKFDIALLTILLCLVFPVAANFINVMCPDGVYTLMLHGMVIVPFFPLVVLECLYSEPVMYDQMKLLVRNGIAVALGIIILFYSYETNISYTSMYYSTRQTENYFNTMVAQIRMTDGFTADKKWAFLGNINDPLLDNYWSHCTRFGGNTTSDSLINRYSRLSWFMHYIGYTVPIQDQDVINSLISCEDVMRMPCWPNAGSICVIDDTVVIKFEELASN